MWIVYSSISILFYAFCEIYEKKGSNIDEENSESKLLVWFGIFGLLVACFVSISGIRETNTNFIEMIQEYPYIFLGTAFYFLSLFFAFISLKFIPVSIEAPITNTSGGLSLIGAIILHMSLNRYEEIAEEITSLKLLLISIIFFVVTIFSIIYHNRVKQEEDENTLGILYKKGQHKKALLYVVVGIVCALLSSLCDAGNSVVSYYVLGEVADSNDYLYLSNMIFFVLGVISWIYISIKEKHIYNPFRKDQLDKAVGACLDCFGMVSNVLAISANPFFADPIISTYFMFTVLLSRFILKEKLSRSQYICIAVLVVCISGFAFLDL